MLGFYYCGRWDLNPHDCNSHKILSLARLPVPTLPRTVSIISKLWLRVNRYLGFFAIICRLHKYFILYLICFPFCFHTSTCQREQIHHQPICLPQKIQTFQLQQNILTKARGFHLEMKMKKN